MPSRPLEPMFWNPAKSTVVSTPQHGGLRDLGTLSGAPAAPSSGGAPSGPAGGDLDGTYPNPTISSSVITTAARTVLDDTTVAAMLATLGGVPTTRTISTTAPVTGGGDLSANRTISVPDFVASGSSHASGLVPDPGGSAGTTKYLREDASWHILPAVATAARYDADALPAGGLSTVSPTTEFMYDQTLGSFTVAADPTSLGVTQAVAPAGMEITVPSGAGSVKYAGFTHATFPSGDFALAFRIRMIGGISNFAAACVGLAQGITTNDDFYGVGFRSANNSTSPAAYTQANTSYTGAASDFFVATGGPHPALYGVIRFGATGNHVTSFLGPDPDSMSLVDFDRTLTFTPARIICYGLGSNRKQRFVVSFIRVIADTYPGSTYDFPPRLAGAFLAGS